MTIGIEAINLYAGRLALDLRVLAAARGKNPAYVTDELMCDQRSVLPPWEDPVTMAVNAAMPLLTDDIRAEIELLIVATESGLDHGKPMSSWVHRHCRLPANCRNFEVKHACYGCTGALKMAASWVASGARPGKKALVINSDLSRSGPGSPVEVLGGAAAVAMLVGDNPRVLAIDPARSGYWSNEIADNMRPTATAEVVADMVSVFSYLDALEGSFDHLERVAGPIEYESFRKHIYHAPFPGMTLQAHRTMLNRDGTVDAATVQTSFVDKVADSLHFARRIGSSYGGSTFVGLLGLLHCSEDLRAGDSISIFSYGGGCQAEFYPAVIGPEAVRSVGSLQLDRQLAERWQITVEEYELFERSREQWAEGKDWPDPRQVMPEMYDDRYRGENLLVLEGVREYIRRYGWS